MGNIGSQPKYITSGSVDSNTGIIKFFNNDGTFFTVQGPIFNKGVSLSKATLDNSKLNLELSDGNFLGPFDIVLPTLTIPASVTNDLSTLKTDSSTLKSDLSTLKTDSSTLKSRIDSLPTNTATLSSDVATLKAQMAALNSIIIPYTTKDSGVEGGVYLKTAGDKGWFTFRNDGSFGLKGEWTFNGENGGCNADNKGCNTVLNITGPFGGGISIKDNDPKAQGATPMRWQIGQDGDYFLIKDIVSPGDNRYAFKKANGQVNVNLNAYNNTY